MTRLMDLAKDSTSATSGASSEIPLAANRIARTDLPQSPAFLLRAPSIVVDLLLLLAASVFIIAFFSVLVLVFIFERWRRQQREQQEAGATAHIISSARRFRVALWVLGVPSTATAGEVKKAYLKLALKYLQTRTRRLM